MILDDVEFHLDAIGETGDWTLAAQVVAIPVLWALSRRKLNNSYEVLTVKDTKEVVGRQITLGDFVSRLLDGVCSTDMFDTAAASFWKAYLPNGTYYADLKTVYGVETLYRLGTEWIDYDGIFKKIDERFSAAHK